MEICISTFIKNRKSKSANPTNLISLLTYDRDDYIKKIKQISGGSDKIPIPLKVNGIPCHLEYDLGSGSKKTVVNLQFLKNLKLSTKLLGDNILFRDYRQNHFKPSSYILVAVQYHSKTITGEMYIY